MEVQTSVKVNINDMCLFTLTDHGRYCAAKYAGRNLSDFNSVRKEPDGRYRMPIWYFIEVFGDEFYNGASQVILHNELEIQCDGIEEVTFKARVDRGDRFELLEVW